MLGLPLVVFSNNARSGRQAADPSTIFRGSFAGPLPTLAEPFPDPSPIRASDRWRAPAATPGHHGQARRECRITVLNAPSRIRNGGMARRCRMMAMRISTDSSSRSMSLSSPCRLSTTVVPPRPHAAPSRPIASADIAVVGAGIVGLCIALSLRRLGREVVLYDALPPGGGASFGNAGLISVDSCIPIALPGMVWQLPKWLLDRHGPLAIHPPRLLAAAPWLRAWVRASRPRQVEHASRALRALHAPALDGYRELLGDAAAGAVIHTRGQLHLWSAQRPPSRADRLVARLRQEQDVATEPLTQAQLKALIPDLADHVRGGIRFPRHAHAIDPQRLTQALASQFEREGGKIRLRRVQRLQPCDDGGFRLWTHQGDDRADRVVVAAGAFSGELLDPLGVRLPLEAERGYHVQLPNPGVTVPVPFIYRDQAVAVTPMEGGLRFAGTVEIAGLRHPPDERRTEAILATARRLFPGIDTRGASVWLGLRPSTPDSVPIIDELRSHPGLYVACGHGHTGLTGAPMTGRLMAARVAGVPCALDPSPYRLSRFS
ncbi:NAD(P)/FAD-dependent oxidoreductase [Cupriavidus gilardii]|uniref:NAD(P)/FAD-dependent oxidoreductase n=1 Tax=Cupriavidus gilardii TaxID=82541 RepID=UPI0020C6DE95|nr:FAD-binding oxidoreductase [Cupriavidus gilardii]